MKWHDRDYIDNRLTDPTGGLLEAPERLKKFHPDLAAKLMTAAQEASRELVERDRS